MSAFLEELEPTEVKELRYAYPTSIMAERCKAKNGLYYVATGKVRDWLRTEHIEKVFRVPEGAGWEAKDAIKAEAKVFMDSLPYPVGRYSL